MSPKLPLSVLLLARDETSRLASLLPSLDFAEEIVVVWDTRGSAETRALAERAGARVLGRELDDFGAQRQFALEGCTRPWVLWIDPDERLDDEAVAGIRRVCGADPVASGFTLERRTSFLGHRIRFCGWQGERVLRLFRRARARFDPAPVHERARVDGPVGRLPGRIHHDAYASWDECVRKMTEYARAGACAAFARGRRAGPLDVSLRPPLRFARMYLVQLGVLDGFHGLLVCALAAAQVFLKYGELWSLSRAAARERS